MICLKTNAKPFWMLVNVTKPQERNARKLATGVTMTMVVMVNAKISHQNAINGRTNAMIQKLPKNAPKLATHVMVNAKISQSNAKNGKTNAMIQKLSKNA